MEDLLCSLGIDQAGKYLAEFEGSIFVVKCGGALVEDRVAGDHILEDIAFLKKNGVRTVLVHGGSVQADHDMEEAGICPRRHRGLRITCDKTIGILEKCFGDLNLALVDRLREKGVEAVGFSGPRGALVRGEKMDLGDGVDLGWVGDMTGIARDVWDSVKEDEVPVVASLGVSEGGRTLNINADYVATQLALRVRARKLILMTDVDGVMVVPGDTSTLISTLTVGRAMTLIDEGIIAGGMIPKIESAVRTIEQGLDKIHIINGRKPHSLLLETLTDGGVGTQIVGE